MKKYLLRLLQVPNLNECSAQIRANVGVLFGRQFFYQLIVKELCMGVFCLQGLFPDFCTDYERLE